MLKSTSLVAAFVLSGFAATLGFVPAAFGGKGSSPGAIKYAIASGSVDAISAELERSELLYCGGCVDDVRPLVDHADPRVRRVAAWWLSRRGLRSELFVEMATRLGQPDSRKAEAAADVLGSLRSVRAIAPLGAALGNPIFDAKARAAMAFAIGRIGDLAGASALDGASRDANPIVRAAALSALRELGPGIDVRPAIAALTDGDEATRVAAIYTIGATRGAGLAPAVRLDATEGLVGLVRNDKSPAVRRKAAWALGEIKGDPGRARPALMTAAQDRDPAVRSLATVALSKLDR